MWTVPGEYRTPRRALKALLFGIRIRLKGVWKPAYAWPRPAYCDCCGSWAWTTRELASRTSGSFCFLCEECAEENDFEWAMAWQEYHGGLL